MNFLKVHWRWLVPVVVGFVLYFLPAPSGLSQNG